MFDCYIYDACFVCFMQRNLAGILDVIALLPWTSLSNAGNMLRYTDLAMLREGTDSMTNREVKEVSGSHD
jgi:hypothetical protein